MARMYMCSCQVRVKHCDTDCAHGKPHSYDLCTEEIFCAITGDFVRCAPMTKTELKKWGEKHANNS